LIVSTLFEVTGESTDSTLGFFFYKKGMKGR
jgi:hypothetical protein